MPSGRCRSSQRARTPGDTSRDSGTARARRGALALLVTLLLMVRPAGACQYDFMLFYDTLATPRADSSVSEPAISNSGDVSFLVRGTIPGTEGEQVPFRWLFRGRVGEPLVAVAVGDQDPSLPHRTNAEGNLAAYFSPIDLSADFLWRDASALLPDVVTVGLDIGLDKTMTYVGPPNGSSVRLIAPMSATSQEILTQTDLMNLGFDLTVTQPWGYSPCLTEAGRLWVSFDGRSGTSGSTGRLSSLFSLPVRARAPAFFGS